MAREDRNYFGDSEIRIDDVVFLENGMVVDCMDCPSYIEKYESPYSTAKVISRITIGQNYERQVKLETIRNGIFITIRESFHFFRVPFDTDLAHRYLRYQVPDFNESPFCVPQGLYIVSGMRKYLRGHVITCTTYKPGENREKYRVSFYQGVLHETNIERLRVITDPESFIAGK